MFRLYAIRRYAIVMDSKVIVVTQGHQEFKVHRVTMAKMDLKAVSVCPVNLVIQVNRVITGIKESGYSAVLKKCICVDF